MRVFMLIHWQEFRICFLCQSLSSVFHFESSLYQRKQLAESLNDACLNPFLTRWVYAGTFTIWSSLRYSASVEALQASCRSQCVWTKLFVMRMCSKFWLNGLFPNVSGSRALVNWDEFVHASIAVFHTEMHLQAYINTTSFAHSAWFDEFVNSSSTKCVKIWTNIQIQTNRKYYILKHISKSRFKLSTNV